MGNWNEILDEHQSGGSSQDLLRRKYLQRLHEVTSRNVIVYYSGWLQKPEIVQQTPNRFSMTDVDKTGFMSVINRLDRTQPLDLILHTPGGEIAYTESLVTYLRAMFQHGIRVIVPEMAMSAGTMLACASDRIVMGKHSSIGPVDPQLGGVAAHLVKEEFERAMSEINPQNAPAWQAVLAKYPIAIYDRAKNAIDLSDTLVKDWASHGYVRRRRRQGGQGAEGDRRAW